MTNDYGRPTTEFVRWERGQFDPSDTMLEALQRDALGRRARAEHYERAALQALIDSEKRYDDHAEAARLAAAAQTLATLSQVAALRERGDAAGRDHH